ncbi:MAG TPA: hypothetical protein VNC84_03255 [Gammaproteobacteria bacterium]|jgi:hypothetical protein|nr:hypothetical protein [Gammaproteobacteria bacterium]
MANRLSVTVRDGRKAFWVILKNVFIDVYTKSARIDHDYENNEKQKTRPAAYFQSPWTVLAAFIGLPYKDVLGEETPSLKNLWFNFIGLEEEWKTWYLLFTPFYFIKNLVILPFAFLLNIVVLFTEVFTEVIAQSCQKFYSYCRKEVTNIDEEIKERNPVFYAIIGFIIDYALWFLHIATKIANHAGRAVSSPVVTVREYWIDPEKIAFAFCAILFSIFIYAILLPLISPPLLLLLSNQIPVLANAILSVLGCLTPGVAPVGQCIVPVIHCLLNVSACLEKIIGLDLLGFLLNPALSAVQVYLTITGVGILVAAVSSTLFTVAYNLYAMRETLRDDISTYSLFSGTTYWLFKRSQSTPLKDPLTPQPDATPLERPRVREAAPSRSHHLHHLHRRHVAHRSYSPGIPKYPRAQ